MTNKVNLNKDIIPPEVGHKPPYWKITPEMMKGPLPVVFEDPHNQDYCCVTGCSPNFDEVGIFWVHKDHILPKGIVTNIANSGNQYRRFV